MAPTVKILAGSTMTYGVILTLMLTTETWQMTIMQSCCPAEAYIICAIRTSHNVMIFMCFQEETFVKLMDWKSLHQMELCLMPQVIPSQKHMRQMAILPTMAHLHGITTMGNQKGRCSFRGWHFSMFLKIIAHLTIACPLAVSSLSGPQ